MAPPVRRPACIHAPGHGARRVFTPPARRPACIHAGLNNGARILYYLAPGEYTGGAVADEHTGPRRGTGGRFPLDGGGAGGHSSAGAEYPEAGG